MMGEPSRRYTVDELIAMRQSLSRMFPLGVCYKPNERAAEVEDQLRTYMLNGTTPEELAEVERAFVQRECEAIRADQELRRLAVKRSMSRPTPRGSGALAG
jgi:hypothetical protein